MDPRLATMFLVLHCSPNKLRTSLLYSESPSIDSQDLCLMRGLVFLG